jgi:hypothetical protein
LRAEGRVRPGGRISNGKRRDHRQRAQHSDRRKVNQAYLARPRAELFITPI